MKQTLNGQIALTKYHSLREFKERLRDGKLMIKAQNELLFLRDTFKFEYYVKRYQLDPEAERRLTFFSTRNATSFRANSRN